MGSFQKFVLFSAIITLIITLVIIGIALSYKKAKITWPPMVPACPDYWIGDGSGNNSKCVNVQDLGTCSAQSGSSHQVMDFGTSTYTGSNGLCSKYTWANNCNVSWDGITYGVPNPCTTSSTTTTTSTVPCPATTTSTASTASPATTTTTTTSS